MCGIAGFLELDARSSEQLLRATANLMSSSLRHRGPDDEGVWAEERAGIVLAHRRLSIVDLSPAGHQPMSSLSGRYMVVYNGEIYNFEELRRELQRSAPSPSFRGHSDTEVLLACLEAWGLEDSLQRWNGMFAFAVWDRETRVLHLGRDRFGEKPLYYAWIGRTLLFGSELKALRAHPGFRQEIDRNALALYLRHSCVPAPHSIYQGVFKLPPASVLTVGGTIPNPPARLLTGLSRTSLSGASPSPSAATSTKQPSNSNYCSVTRSAAAWWPMCRSAFFFPEAWILRL